MARFTNFLGAALLAGSLAASASAASAQTAITLSGTVQRVGAHLIAVWENRRSTTGEWIVSNPSAFRAGEYVVGTGTEDQAGHFYPRRVHIAGTPSAVSLSGVVQRVGPNWIDVWENGHNETGQWIVSNAPGYRVGQTVTGWGTEDRFGNFFPQRISVGAVPTTVTLRGTVQRVGTHMIAVWEPSRRTTGDWIVAHAGQFRVGERVAANGTVDSHGDFFPRNIWTP